MVDVVVLVAPDLVAVPVVLNQTVRVAADAPDVLLEGDVARRTGARRWRRRDVRTHGQQAAVGQQLRVDGAVAARSRRQRCTMRPSMSMR